MNNSKVKQNEECVEEAYIPNINVVEKESGLYHFYINRTDENKKFKFKNNEIDTTKYNAITFLPKSLFYQFIRPANVYFLICAILQCIPAISPLSPATAVIPIVVVLSVSLIREAIEDCKRRSLDKQQNSEPVEVYSKGTWKNTISGNINLGEIVLVKKDDTFPADLILIDSNLPEGICFIETGTLDGEKTLKLKESPKFLAGKYNNNGERLQSLNISGAIIADKPNPQLYQLNGRMSINVDPNMADEDTPGLIELPLDAKQLLLKGAKLRNTQWILGIVVYTGHNTKIMKNAKDPLTKYSSLEGLMNDSLVFIFISQAFLCILCAVFRGVFYKYNNLEKTDRDDDSESSGKYALTLFGYTLYSYGVESFINYFTYLLLLNTMIPISLIITLEIVKLIQGAFMNCDIYGYSHLRKKWIQPNSVSLNEECGLVSHIFSDKTGTLTCNKMEFKYCVIGDNCYEYVRDKNKEESKKNIAFRKEEKIIPFNKLDMIKAVENNNSAICKSNYQNFILRSSENSSIEISLESSQKLIDHYWYALSLCNTCSIQEDENGEQNYICISPDSIELVKTARDQGWELIPSDKSSIRKIKRNGKVENMEKLELAEFTSDRKRETIIVRNKEGKIILYCKGADSIIEQRLGSNNIPEIVERSKYYVNKFSSQGFRTLFIAMKVLSENEYRNFQRKLEKAQMNFNDKDKEIAKAYELIENDLSLIGVTIVEDKLQENVPETIKELRFAGIKIWMLTGDKMNTAYNIGLSCNLISTKMQIFYVKGVEPKKEGPKLNIINQKEMDKVIIDFHKDFEKFKGEFESMEKFQFGILVDEKALLTISQSEDLQKIFLGIAKEAIAVICCRVSPLQKSQVVKMMRKFDPSVVTLAIGDGGNDVSMIMEAHIGVGIYGEEGLRAVQSSDYAIGEFQFLRSILLYHGRTNYVRNAECIAYFFYKNFVFTLIQFIFGFYCNFSGQTIIDDWFITLFNLVFTSLPLGARALLDHDVKPSDGKIINKMLPFIYQENRDRPIFTIPKFLLSLLKGLIHCLINFFFVVYCLREQSSNSDGYNADLWFTSVNLFTNILLIVSINLMIYTKYITWVNVAILGVVTFLAYIIFLILVHNLSMFNSVGTMLVSFGSPFLWLNLIFVCVTCGLIDYSSLILHDKMFPRISKKLQELVNKEKKLDSEESLPIELKEKLWLLGDENETKKEEKKTSSKNSSNNNDEPYNLLTIRKKMVKTKPDKNRRESKDIQLSNELNTENNRKTNRDSEHGLILKDDFNSGRKDNGNNLNSIDEY